MDLQSLIHHGSMTIGRLSHNMALSCSTIIDLIGRMQGTGLVTRE